MLTYVGLRSDDERMATDPSIGTRIRKRRQVLGMTQQQLAERVDVNRSTVATWESGKHFPLRYLGRVESVLGISLSDEEQPQLLSPRARKVLREELSEEDYRRVVGLAEQTLARQDGITAAGEEAPGPRPA